MGSLEALQKFTVDDPILLLFLSKLDPYSFSLFFFYSVFAFLTIYRDLDSNSSKHLTLISDGEELFLASIPQTTNQHHVLCQKKSSSRFNIGKYKVVSIVDLQIKLRSYSSRAATTLSACYVTGLLPETSQSSDLVAMCRYFS